jgi:hypothetical protein
MTIGCSWRATRSAVALVLTILLSACAVTGTTSTRVAPETTKLTALQVEFDPSLPDTGRVVTTAPGIFVPLIAQTRVPLNTQRSQEAAAQFGSVFSDGFRDRFPGLAAAYGLQISPTSPTLLKLRVPEVTTQCTARCVTRIMLAGDLVSANGTVVWQFVTKPGQVSLFDKIDDALFDRTALELLDSMKKDGLIGG